MTALSDAQLNLYFGDGKRPLTHSQSSANLLRVKCSSSSLSDSCGSGLSDYEIAVSSSSYSDNEDDIYSVVAWQLGHDRIGEDRVGSISDTTPQTNQNKHKKFNRKGLKWKFKKLFQQKKTLQTKKLEKLKNEKHQKLDLSHSQSTIAMTTSLTVQTTQNGKECIPKSIKLKSPTNREIRFELVLYESKRGKLRYKLMDNKLSKCICSNVDRFDTKTFLSKHRMSIDYELQLIQTLQCYKEVMLKTQNINDQNLKKHKNNSSNSSSSSSALSLSENENFGNLNDENEDENFDLFHVTTPRSKCIRFETMIDRIYDRYNLHTTQTSNYSKLRKKQQRIESFYKDKVADKHSIELLANNEKMHFLTSWNSGKRGLKITKSEKISSNVSDESSAMILNIESKTKQNDQNDEFESSNVQQTEIEDADDELLSEEDDEEQSEDDSDASMDSDTLNRILFESSQQTQKRHKNETNVCNKKSIQNKPKNVIKKGGKKSKKVSKKEIKNVSYAPLKPPSSNQKKKKKNSQKKKKKRKQFKKRKKYIPRFMQTKKAKSATPRKAHKMKLCDLNDSDNDGSKKKFKGMRVKKRTHSKSFKVTKVAENSFDILYVDREIHHRRRSSDGMYQKRIQIGKASQSDVGVLGSEYFGSLHSPQYLRLKSKNGEAKMVPMRVLDFGKDDF